MNAAHGRRLARSGTLLAGAALTLAAALVVNWIFQVVRKPSELLFPVSGVLYKTPTATWQEYGALFETYSTPVMTPGLLAAMAQVEGSGNPLARTYWRWLWTLRPFDVYRPASSAVGMYQITDGTWAEARRYCMRHHVAMACGMTGWYARVVPAYAVELTAADLDRRVALILEHNRMRSVSLRHRQDLAAVIHLCGAGAGDAYAHNDFRLHPAQRCGDQEVRAYLARITAMQRFFDRLARPACVSAAAPSRPC